MDGNKKMTINLIDLFSGAGGLTEGFSEHDNFRVLGHVEKDFSASQTLKLRESFHYLSKNEELGIYFDYLNNKITLDSLFENIPDAILNKVINEEISNDSLKKIFDKLDDIVGNSTVNGIIGGPPCQAYSTIGRARNVLKKDFDNRIYLYEFYIEFLKKFNPDFFVFENVKGLLSFRDSNNELLLPKIESDFEKAGYNIQYEIINTKFFDVPQSRERLIIFGAKNHFKNMPKDFFDVLNSKKSNTISTVREALIGLPALGEGEMNNSYTAENSDYVNKYFKRIDNVPLTQNFARPHNKRDLEIYKQVSVAKLSGKNLKYNELSPRLKTHKHDDKFLDRFKALSWDSPSHTVVAHIAKDGHHYIHPDINQNRSITVREAARLQGFPDDYYFLYSRTSAFTQIGNAVPPILSQKFSKVISEIYKID